MAYMNYYVLTAGMLLTGLVFVCAGKAMQHSRIALAASTVSEHEIYQSFLSGKTRAVGFEEGPDNPVRYWKTAGKEVSYTYTDLNGDETDELIVRVDEWPTVFTMKDGDVYYTGNGWYSGVSGFNVCSNGDMILHDDWHEGRDYYWRYRLDDSAFSLIETIGHESSDDDEYYRGETRISKAEYDETREAMFEDVRELNWESLK